MRPTLAALIAVVLASCGSGGDDNWQENFLEVQNGDGNGVRLRVGPGTNYDIIATVTVGCLVEAVGPPENYWAHVEWQGMVGYVHGSYVSPASVDAPGCQSDQTAD